MKTRRIVLLTLIALVAVVLLTTIAFAANSRQAPATSGSSWETMHNSAAMRQVHDQMPAELRARCDSMHAQMTQMHANMGGMMGGMGMMGGASMGGSMMGS